MSPTMVLALAAAELLSVLERRELVELLAIGLEDVLSADTDVETPSLTEAWRQEVAYRSAEYDARRVPTVTWEEVQARWQSRIADGGVSRAGTLPVEP